VREPIRVLAAGIAGAVAWWAGIAVVFGLAQGILTDPNRQSAKFLFVLTEPPLPRMAEKPSVFAWGFLVVAIVYARAFAWLDPKLAGGIVRKGAAFGLLAWALMVPWFEFYLPWNVMLEPLPLVIVEAACWLVVLVGVGLSVSSVYRLVGRRATGENVGP
jgi:hypothetical protein